MTNFLRSTTGAEYGYINIKRLAAGLGLLSHMILRRGEWDHSSHILCYFYVFAFVALTALEYMLDPLVDSVWQALCISGSAASIYAATLLTSIFLYRAFFHRLRKFPGPFLLRLSKFCTLRYVLPHFQYYAEVENLHKKYNSDIVRTGPRELSIISVEAIPLIHGPASKCTKGPWYEQLHHLEGSSMHNTRSKKDHRERRRGWDRALNAKSLREYEPRINRHTLNLISKLHEHAQEPSVRISNWVNFYSFDVIGDIGFSRSFGMIERGEEDSLIEMLHKSMWVMAVFNHVPWALSLLSRLGAARDVLKFTAWTTQTLGERAKIVPKENDVFGYLLHSGTEEVPFHLNADSKTMIVAGSDTTSATLTWLFYELCKNPSVQSNLRTILDSILPEKSFLDAIDLEDCPYLDAVINEALRLHPPNPSGVQRETPKEGLTLPDGTFIPGRTLIWMPLHTIHRDERYFSLPLTFAPERWTALHHTPASGFDADSGTETRIDPAILESRTYEDMETKNAAWKPLNDSTINTVAQTSIVPKIQPLTSPYTATTSAFMPFGVGAYNCVGQKLARMEIRSVVANVVRSFDIAFADGETGRSMERETIDCFTTCVGTLDVRLTPRRNGE